MQDTEIARLMTLQRALEIEIIGLTQEAPSVYSLIKNELNLKGSRQDVYNQLEEVIFKARQMNLELE